MDPRDDLDSLGDGVDCAACGQFVPTERIRVLARRDDIAFVEIHCEGCRSESLGIVIAADAEQATTPPADGSPTSRTRRSRQEDAADLDDVAVGPGRVYGEFGPRDAERFREALPIGAADLVRVRELLARGDLSILVEDGDRPSDGRAR